MSTTIWGYPATLRLELRNGYSIAIDDFLKWSDVGNAPAIDLEKILDAVHEVEMRDYPLCGAFAEWMMTDAKSSEQK